MTLVSEALSSAQTLARDMVVELDHPTAGQVKTLGLPIRMSGTPLSVRSVPSELGQDTEDVLTELGYTPTDITTLRSADAI